MIADGEPSARKALLQALVDEIRVQSRDEIYSFFTLLTVRPPYGSVHPAPLEPASFDELDETRPGDADVLVGLPT